MTSQWNGILKRHLGIWSNLSETVLGKEVVTEKFRYPHFS